MTTNQQGVVASHRLCAALTDFRGTDLVVGEWGQSLEMLAKLAVGKAVVEIAEDLHRHASPGEAELQATARLDEARREIHQLLHHGTDAPALEARLRRNDYPEGRFTLAFVGYGEESEQAVIELTHNWDTSSYELGDGFGHIAIEVPDAYRACDEIRARGGRVVRDAGPMKHGSTVIAFVEDPDGYKIELIHH